MKSLLLILFLYFQTPEEHYADGCFNDECDMLASYNAAMCEAECWPYYGAVSGYDARVGKWCYHIVYGTVGKAGEIPN